ncbi:MAG: hypothetical protein M3539_02060 [Acidobacteriota bacterium]|nr:hypothetical protein [Acidobacteriota bacterium]
MNIRLISVIALLSIGPGITLMRGEALAQSDTPKREVGVLFSVLGIDDANGLSDLFPRTEVGVGGRFGYNLKRYLALEAELNFFPRDFRKFTTNFTGGRMMEGLFGVKAGIRKHRFGVFGKFRPGFESSGRAEVPRFPNGNGPDPRNPFGFERVRATQFALDVGGVFEWYPTRRTIVRFDAGDTIVRYPNVEFIQFPQGIRVLQTVYSHKPQFSAGFGFRF